ncbi:MAG: NAD-dependent epimerase/dehydratase family protein [Gemmatimonadota bacterium]|nr:NAD-dependent epimerase/dehydratase family protein [Gemmatimonadota bacterium]
MSGTVQPQLSVASPVLVTGGGGFLGTLLLERLANAGVQAVSLDLHDSDFVHPGVRHVKGDICDGQLVNDLFEQHRFVHVFHCAAMLAHDIEDEKSLWQSNVEGTRVVASAAVRFGVQSLVFTSSNCLWGRDMGRPVTERDVPEPIEIYGRSKWKAEQVLAEVGAQLPVTVIRCPTILDEGRLGLLAILFEFIAEGRKIWTVGGAKNRYQFIYAQDLITACLLAAAAAKSLVVNIGSHDVPTLAETFQYVVDRAGSGSRLVAIPKGPAIAAMRLAHALRLSPLGPYQYRMIAEDFVFDTSLIKAELGWRPTLGNGEMLWRAYNYYRGNRTAIASRTNASAHRRGVALGILRILKILS